MSYKSILKITTVLLVSAAFILSQSSDVMGKTMKEKVPSVLGSSKYDYMTDQTSVHGEGFTYSEMTADEKLDKILSDEKVGTKALKDLENLLDTSILDRAAIDELMQWDPGKVTAYQVMKYSSENPVFKNAFFGHGFMSILAEEGLGDEYATDKFFSRIFVGVTADKARRAAWRNFQSIKSPFQRNLELAAKYHVYNID